MVKLIYQAFRVARPVHWTKNLSIFAAIIFTGLLFDEILFTRVVWAFVAFSFATSATYIFNDIFDEKSDKLHPIKKNRPIASGQLPKGLALIELMFLIAISLKISSLLHPLFFISVVAYLILQFFYTLFLKHLPTIDILIIATGFVIRTYAGAFVIDAHLSVWFLLCVVSVALFLASGKRRSEYSVIEKSPGTRKSLAGYDKELLTSYVTMFGSASWLSWALFTFYESPPVSKPIWLFFAELSKTTTVSKLLMATIPVVIFTIMRYQNIIFSGRSEAPEKVLLTDYPLVISVIVWTMMVVWILYFAGYGYSLSAFIS